ncbi:hypothetical protein DSL64_06485 [Dyadobacter luteus]|uniref:YfbU family protein n=1 Tax=Dyadobacter luteus TaxID=2259619 RepID=A0A3D8YFA2_9BACT|nr:YfbU family protein [Dyadobacter luteus]REA63258.1 hypothetical protein DSL64_06485 [Dyadobacter luteus]
MIPTTLTLEQRQMLINQFRLLLVVENEEQQEQLAKRIEILEKGYTGLYPKVFDQLYEEIPISVYNDVEAILAMYKRINESVRNLPISEQELLNLASLEFEGFDDNNEMYYHMMSYLVDRMDEHHDYRGRNLRSHNPLSMVKYNKMLAVYNRLQIANSSHYSSNELQEFIDALIEEVNDEIKENELDETEAGK